MAEIDLSVDASKSVTPIRDLADALEQVQQATVDTGKTFDKAFSSSTDAVDDTTDALVDQAKVQEKNSKQTDDLRKETVKYGKDAKKAYDDKKVKEQNKAVKDVDKSTGNLEKATKDMGKTSSGVFDDLSEGLGDVKDGFSDIGGSIASGDAGGIQGGLSGILGKLGPIGIGIGAVTAGAFALGSEIIEIDKKFDGLRASVNSLFDVTEEQADRIVVNVEAIANTFDQDVNEVLIATNTLAKEFGISGEEASNLLSSGFNSAANAQDDLIDSVKEFSSQVRASGGTAEDLFAVLEKSNQEGIFSDKGIDVVKEFGLRIREQTDGTKEALENAFGPEFSQKILKGVSDGSLTSIEALREVSGALGGLDESAASTQTLIADVFGGPGEDAGFRFLSLLKDVNSEQSKQNKELTEAQKRQQENLDSNKRLAAAQNELSKAIGDSSAFGRIWLDIQTLFVEALVGLAKFVNEVAAAFEDWGSFQEFAIKQTVELVDAITPFVDLVDKQAKSWNELTDAEKVNVGIKREAIKAIRDYGKETGALVSSVEKSITALQEGTLTDEGRLRVVNQLNEQFPEQIGNIDLLTASEEELLQVKQDIIRAEVEEDILRKKRFAVAQLETQLEIRRSELAAGVSDARRKILEDEIEFLDTQFRERIDLVEEEVRIELGLIERKNDEIVEDAELTEEELLELGKEGAKKRAKQRDEFNKLIEEIIKRGRAAERADQFISQEERINAQRDFQREELANLLEHAQDRQEQLTGSRELEQNVIDKFNRADEKIITDAQDKIFKIQEAAANRERKRRIDENRAVLGIRQDFINDNLSLLQSQEEEEIALIEQQEKKKGEFTGEFERRKQKEILDAQEFYLSERIALIDLEQNLKLQAIEQELAALEGKEGAEVELKKQSLEQKKGLLEQETNTQREQLDLQLQNIQDSFEELDKIKGPTLGEVFDDLNVALAESFGLSPEQLSAITGALQQVAGEVFNTIQESVAEQIAANDEVLAKLDEREQEVKDSLDREIAFAQAGYAANVSAKRDELAQIQEAEENAQKQRADLLRQQEQLDTISQSVSLVTASANLYKSLSVLPFGVGIAIATLLTAGMFAAFASSKAKSKAITKLEKGGSGDSTGMFTGARHSQGGVDFLDQVEVEDGEMWSVFNRGASGKHADMIREFSQAVNTDNVDKFMMDHSAPDVLIEKKNGLKGSEISLQSALISEDIKKDISVLPEIKAALIDKFSEAKEYIYKDGKDTFLLQVKPNGSRKKIKLKSK